MSAAVNCHLTTAELLVQGGASIDLQDEVSATTGTMRTEETGGNGGKKGRAVVVVVSM